MRRLIVKGLFFGSLSIFFYFSFFWLLNSIRLPFLSSSPLIFFSAKTLYWKGGHTYQLFREFDRNRKYDIIVLGTSHAYRGYDPRIFKNAGYSTYNLGTSGQDLIGSYFIAKNHITKENCKLVIFDIFEGSFISDPLEAAADLIQNINIDKSAWQMSLALRDIRTINMLTLRWFNRNKKPVYIDSTYHGLGFSEKKDSVKNPINYTASLFSAKKESVNYFRKTLRYFHEQGIKIVLVSHPLPLEYNRDYHEQFKKTIVPILNEFNLIYLDYTFNHSLNSKYHYYDSNHLNQAGVEIFDVNLINDMKDKGLLW